MSGCQYRILIIIYIVSCIVRSFASVFHIVRSFHFVRSCIVRSFRVSCVFLYRLCEVFVRFSFISFAFLVRLRLVRIVNLYDPWYVPVEQELLTLPEHLSSPTVFSGVRVTRILVLFVCFLDRCLSFFSWPLYCLSFVDLWILISPVLSFNSSSAIYDQSIILQ